MNKELKDYTKALFLIDMNNGFCEKGNLADPTIKHIVPNIIPIIRKVLEEKEAFFVVNDKHSKDSCELKQYLEHCMGDEESRTIKELAIYEPYATKTFFKNSPDALFAKGMIETILAMENLKQVIIVGCCTDICIKHFAIALRDFLYELNLDIDIIVPIDAVETYHIADIHDRDKMNKNAFDDMKTSGITLVKTMKGGK